MRLAVNPQSNVITDTYVDTGTLQLLYDPPVQIDNRSSKLMYQVVHTVGTVVAYGDMVYIRIKFRTV